MCRCIACNRQLSGEELENTKPDGNVEDMCLTCLSKAGFNVVDQSELPDWILKHSN